MNIALIAVGSLAAWSVVTHQDNMLASKALSAAESSTTTDRFKGLVDNGYQFRDVMFSTMADYLSHPDVKNNFFAHQRASQATIHDQGIFGVPRKTVQLYPGVSEPIQMYRAGNMAL